MDFSRQCKRFLNYRVIGPDQTKRRLSNIAAIGLLRSVHKVSGGGGAPLVSHRIVVADNDQRALYVLNESDGQVLREAATAGGYVTYGLCCTSSASTNTNKPVSHIYVSDFTNGVVRKYDEQLVELRQLQVSGVDGNDQRRPLSGPCGIAVNYELQQVQVVDQRNCRVVCFDLRSDEYAGEFALFEDDLHAAARHERPVAHDLSTAVDGEQHREHVRTRARLNFWPFGLCTKGDRVYVTDWERGLLSVYKSGRLERRIGGSSSSGGGGRAKLFTRPRNILLDSLDSILVADLDRDSFFFLDNKGVPLFETRAPKHQSSSFKTGDTTTTTNSNQLVEERGVFGLERLDNKLIFASNTFIYVCNLLI